LLDLATTRDRELLASASLTSVALAIPVWKERTAQAATGAVKVLEVRLIGPNATILAVVCFRAAPPSATVPALSVPLYESCRSISRKAPNGNRAATPTHGQVVTGSGPHGRIHF
jgi:hypothetical protein